MAYARVSRNFVIMFVLSALVYLSTGVLVAVGADELMALCLSTLGLAIVSVFECMGKMVAVRGFVGRTAVLYLVISIMALALNPDYHTSPVLVGLSIAAFVAVLMLMLYRVFTVE
jgi:hypothetical protein